MKYLVSAFLIVFLVSSTVDAQSTKPVDAAFDIYFGCMLGYYQAAKINPTRDDIKNFVYDAHEQCFIWMNVWYKPITGYAMKISEWDYASQEQLDKRIAKNIRDMNVEIRIILGVK